MKKCINCGNYRVFYIKTYARFRQETQGQCLKRNKIVHVNHSCSKWTTDSTVRTARKIICSDIVDGTDYDLLQIAQILDEEEKREQEERAEAEKEKES